MKTPQQHNTQYTIFFLLTFGFPHTSLCKRCGGFVPMPRKYGYSGVANLKQMPATAAEDGATSAFFSDYPPRINSVATQSAINAMAEITINWATYL